MRAPPDHADPHAHESRTRSLRLHGAVTSIRLENLFWQALEDKAAREGSTMARLLEQRYLQWQAANGSLGNFTSYLRVCALREHVPQARS